MSDEIKVLVLDDDQLVRESIAAYLEDEGFLVTLASTAEEALEKLGSMRHDVCITDYTLPGMDGESLILLGHDKSPKTHFIMHTGAVFSPSDGLLEIGFTCEDVMVKPITRLELLTEKVLNLARKKD